MEETKRRAWLLNAALAAQLFATAQLDTERRRWDRRRPQRRVVVAEKYVDEEGNERWRMPKDDHE